LDDRKNVLRCSQLYSVEGWPVVAEPNEERRTRGWVRPLGGALVLVVLAACGSAPTAPTVIPTPFPTPTPTPAPPRVALISIDGLRPDALTTTTAPSLVALAERGSYTWTAQTIFPSTTLPSHASMLTGVEPSAHGVTFDEYRDSFQLKVPTVFSLARAAGKRTVFVAGKDKFRQLALAGSADSFVLATRGDVDVVNETIVQLPLGFDLLFVHLPQVDHTGHASGWMSPEYMAQLQQTDAAVGRLVSQLPAGTTVIVTADHGGQNRTHGTVESCDMTIPWIVAGPRVVRRGPLTRTVRTVDTALTILTLLGVPAPAKVSGRFVSEPFEAQP
jgi:predicted AlkP superfamily pyrophosphatase or phosphodiesterase